MLGIDSQESLDCKEIKRVNSKGSQSWIFIGRTDVEAEAPIFQPIDVKSWLIRKDPLAGKDGRQEGKGDNRGWDGWMASLIRWTWVWVNSGSWWWIGRPGMLRFMGLQRVGHDWATDLIWSDLMVFISKSILSDMSVATPAFFWSPFSWNIFFQAFTFRHGEGNGNPIQYSCLENRIDRGTWQAAVHSVAKSWTQLKWLSTAQHSEMEPYCPYSVACFFHPWIFFF